MDWIGKMECIGRFEAAKDLFIFEIKDECTGISDVSRGG